jgi:hypothetical protein
MNGQRTARYLKDIAGGLRARGAFSPDLVDELRDHLRDSIEAAERRGLSSAAAEDEAIARMGAAEIVVRHAAADAAPVRRGLLLGICATTMAAIVYLSLSLLILRPPRANYTAWSIEAAAVAVLTALTFTWARTGGLEPWRRPLLMAGSVGLAAAGGTACYTALTGDFDGYRVVLGALFSVQAVLTLGSLPRERRAAWIRS